MSEAADQSGVILANLPAGPVERRTALVIGLALLLMGAAVAPFGKTEVPHFDAWAPVTATSIFIADLITWFLLISQFNVVRSRALLVLASGYLFTAIVNVPILLTFPDLVGQKAFFGASFQTSSWVGIFGFLGYPLAVLMYAAMKKEPETLVSQGSTRAAIVISIVIVIAVNIAMTWIVTAADPYLPRIIPVADPMALRMLRIGSLFQIPTGVAIVVLTAVVISLLWIRGLSVLHVWLMVVMCGWLAQGLALWTFASNRYTFRWYASRFIFLSAMTVVLVVLLKESMTLYSRLAVSLVALRRLSAEKLERSEAYLTEGQRLSHTGSFGWNVASGEIFWSDESFKIFGYEQTVIPSLEVIFHRIPLAERDFVKQTIDRAIAAREDFDFEHRLLMPDGSTKHLHVIARARQSSQGDLEFVGSVMDVTVAKQAGEKIRQSETEFRQILELAPQHVAVIAQDANSTRLYANSILLDYFGFTLEEWRTLDRSRGFHPDDWGRYLSETQSSFHSGAPFEAEVRLLGKDGKYRWFLFRWSPIHDEHGQLQRWYVAGIDIEDRKRAEQRLREENVALREEIDRASMYEEIVGVSPALRAVLSRVSKVAPTDSTVLINGETGTGKELIARAVHRRSNRSSRAFISVNCASIPHDLIASELFGHEKGAFTGALQRRLGRFELAEGGTIFLDEIGELPADTQVALLRVLQEREFERVGGSATIRANVRVIAATNRDLPAAIESGRFRSDLFYRLNVFPIEVPPLRERQEDIPLLVEYFIDRFARKAGKRISSVNKESLELLQSYRWPGNIRELQNVIERSVIVCETENFFVDESWLSRQPAAAEPKFQAGLSRKLAAEEREIIEAALLACGGRVSGPSGAAVLLGLPGSTLDSKIRSLRIDKNRFKHAVST